MRTLVIALPASSARPTTRQISFLGGTEGTTAIHYMTPPGTYSLVAVIPVHDERGHGQIVTPPVPSTLPASKQRRTAERVRRSSPYELAIYGENGAGIPLGASGRLRLRDQAPPRTCGVVDLNVVPSGTAMKGARVVREAAADDYEWATSQFLLGGAFCVTYLRGVDETETLNRFGADTNRLRPMTYLEASEIDLEFGGGVCVVALAQQCDEWTVVLEPNGWLGMDLTTISAGTTAISVYQGVNRGPVLTYAREGMVLTSFESLFANTRDGVQPDVLLTQMIALGIDENLGEERFGKLLPCTLALAERVSGVRLDAEVVNGPWLGGLVPPA